MCSFLFNFVQNWFIDEQTNYVLLLLQHTLHIVYRESIHIDQVVIG